MLLNQLHEWDEVEAESARRNALVAHRTLQGGSYTERTLYPELALKPPYTYCIGTIPASFLLPLYETVIVDLRPLPTPDSFRQRYGLSVEQFSRYVEQGRIATRMRVPFARFEGLHYLDSLIQRRPPVSQRYVQFHGDEHGRYLDEGRRLCPSSAPISQRWRGEYLDWTEPPTFREVFAYKFALVGCYFGADEASRLVQEALGRTHDAGTAYDWLHIFSRARVYPMTNSLDGVNTLGLSDLRDARTVCGMTPQSDAVPFEVGRALMLNLPISLPDDLDRALAVQSTQWTAAVRALDDALSTDSRLDPAEALRRISVLVQDTRIEVERMQKRLTKLRRAALTIGALGVVGVASDLFPDWKPIVGAVGGLIAATHTKIINSVVKLRKPSHVTAWFDLQSSLRH